MNAVGLPAETPVVDPDHTFIRELVRARSAIVLEPGKAYLIESRLAPVARSEGLGTLRDLVIRLRAGIDEPLQRKVVEALTTNETSFFRDHHPFEALRQQILPELFRSRSATRMLNLWSAACSTGQEAYSIAIAIREYLAEHAGDLGEGWRVRILATDLATRVLARARAGAFTQLEINRGLPAAFAVKYFRREGTEWIAHDSIRQMIDFREMNLAAPWPSMPPMDVVFLRNVLIYFATDTKKEILGKVRRVLRPDGVLFLGTAETTLNLDEAFERVRLDKVGGCYQARKS
jgi:chemotaxis protein methyltransferase CheR